MKTGERIRLFREKKGLSQTELAKAAGYDSRSSISKIESGESDPSQKMLIRLAAALEVNASDLLSDTPVFEEDISSLVPKTLEARIVSFGMDNLPKEEREKILSIPQTMYRNNPDLFKEDRSHDNDA